MSSTRTEQFSIGRVVGRTFSTVGGNFVPFFLIAVILIAAPSALSAWLQSLVTVGATVAPGDVSVAPSVLSGGSAALIGPIAWLVLFIVGIALNATAQGAIIYGVVADLGGRKASLGDMLARGWARWWKLFLINICVGFMVALGSIALFVPGIMLLIRWSAAVPVEIMETKGVFGSMGRSAELTKGSRWSIFGLGLVVFIILILIEFLVAAIVLPGAGFVQAVNMPLFRYAIAPLISVITVPLSAAGTAALYFELRSTKEGVGVDQLASVFD